MKKAKMIAWAIKDKRGWIVKDPLAERDMLEIYTKKKDANYIIEEYYKNCIPVKVKIEEI